LLATASFLLRKEVNEDRVKDCMGIRNRKQKMGKGSKEEIGERSRTDESVWDFSAWSWN